MIQRRARVIAVWVLCVAAALVVVARARYVTDLSAFLPGNPTPVQQLLVDQLRDGPASRLILIALEQGDARTRAALAAGLAGRLRRDDTFTSVDDGEPLNAERDHEFLFEHRYLLSDGVTAERFSTAGLHASISDTIDDLASSTGLLLKSLVPHDPTGETVRVIDRLAHARGPRTVDDAWVSADGTRTLLVAQTAAAGSDTDAQARALGVIRSAFADCAGPNAAHVALHLSGPSVFAVQARDTIERAAMGLSLVSSLLIIALLLAVYRSVVALVLGLLPVVTGAVSGVAAVALGFGVVHGICLGFGITLIGESVDYSIYFFIQSRRDGAQGSWQRLLWPTIRLGMFTSVCGFASLLPSGFPGLAQLGLYSISGLIAAALVTRFVLPELLPPNFVVRDVTPLGLRLGAVRDTLRRRGGVVAGAAGALAAAAVAMLVWHHATLWNHELSALSPVPLEDQRYDAELRADLGSADVLDLVVVSGTSLEEVLRGAERVAAPLQALIDQHVIGQFDSPADFLPSEATQQARRDALPDAAQLHARLHEATTGLDLDADRLTPFVDDVEKARRAPLLNVADLRDSSLAAGFNSLVLHRGNRWTALLPLHAAARPAAPQGTLPDIDAARVAAALAAAGLSDTHLLDLKAETDALYANYLHEAMRLSLAGFLVIVLMLAVTLRSPARVVRVLAPLVLSVLVVAATLAALDRQLTLLNLVGMLLIVAVGSNYALFFDHEGRADAQGRGPLTLASLGIANLSTVIGFGLLSFSQVPVLVALGATVAPGAFLALLFSAVLTAPALSTGAVHA